MSPPLGQVMRHPWVKEVGMGTILAAHPWDPPNNHTPVVHHHPTDGWSILINANSNLQHRDRVLADGETIEFRPCPASPQDLLALDALAGVTTAASAANPANPANPAATLYVLFQGRGAQGTVRVAKAGGGAYHLRLLNSQPGVHTAWADMEDSE